MIFVQDVKNSRSHISVLPETVQDGQPSPPALLQVFVIFYVAYERALASLKKPLIPPPGKPVQLLDCQQEKLFRCGARSRGLNLDAVLRRY